MLIYCLFASDVLTYCLLGIEKWNTEEVVNWAKGVVRHELAEVLKSQEVDGKSLLTLTKDDLIKAPYSFPGGPAASLALAIAELADEQIICKCEMLYPIIP